MAESFTVDLSCFIHVERNPPTLGASADGAILYMPINQDPVLYRNGGGSISWNAISNNTVRLEWPFDGEVEQDDVSGIDVMYPTGWDIRGRNWKFYSRYDYSTGTYWESGQYRTLGGFAVRVLGFYVFKLDSDANRWKYCTATTGHEIVTIYGTSGSYFFTVVCERYADIVYNSNDTRALSQTFEAEGAASRGIAAPEAWAKTGYNLAGWNTAADGSGTSYAPGARLRGLIGGLDAGVHSVNLYAEWEATKSNVAFDQQGGLGGTATTEATYDSAMPSITLPTLAGYEFGGYYTQTNGGGEQYYTAEGASAKNWDKTGDAILYAKWTAIENTLTVNPNGGTYDGHSEPVDLTVTYDSGVNSTLVVPVKPGYAFEGFYTAASGGTMVYDRSGNAVAGEYWDNNGIWRSTSDLTVYAHWVQVFTVSFGSYEGGAEVIYPASPDKTVSGTDYYAAGREVRIRLTPLAGRKAVQVQWVVEGISDGSPVSVDDDGVVIIANLTGNTVGLVTEEAILYTVTAAAHSASTEAITAEVRLTAGQLPADGKYHYGDTVTFTATPETGYAFEGWYDENGTKVASTSTYAMTVAGDIALYAKAKVQVTMGIVYPDGTADAQKTCGITVNGEAYTAAFDVTLGESFDYALALGVREESSNWELNGWYESSTPDLTQDVPLPYAQAGTITPTEAMTMYAAVVADATKMLKVYIVNMGTSANEVVSKTDLPSAVKDTAIQFTLNVQPSYISHSGMIPLAGGGGAQETQTAVPFRKTMSGTQYVKIDAIDAITFTGETEAKNFYGLVKTFDATYDGNLLPPDEDVISRSTETIVLVTRDDAELYAFYGEARNVTTTIAFAGGSTGRGEIAIAGETGTSKTALQGTTLTLTATAHNGYKFKGWFSNASGNGSALYTGETAVVPVTSERTLYACFTESDRAIYEWEGSGTNKEFTWRSKTYSATRPFNPSVARVDAEGYPLEELTVEMFSSPDKAATQSVKLTDVGSQTMRRLPARRPERYLQVEVKSVNAVNALIVSTSAEEARA